MSDIIDLWNRQLLAPPASPLRARPARLPDPAAIAPREWLYGTRLVRRYLTVLAAPGGVGKSALALGIALALATGRPLLGERVRHRVNAWVLNLEDPLDELDRRTAALMRLHDIDRAELDGRLYLDSGRARRLCMAEPGPDGITHPDQQAVIDQARLRAIGLIVVDPFVKSHRLDENANRQIDAAATAWAEVAEETGAAVLLVHHVRKGAGEDGDIEAARGAKALTDAARQAALLRVMNEEEAGRYEIPPAERWRHVRLDDAKANLAAPPDRALWFRLESVPLGNATALYPEGDSVGALACWRPPSAVARLSAVACNQALDRIARGLPDGSRYGALRVGRSAERWAGSVLVNGFGFDERAAARVIALWLKNGLLVDEVYHHPGQRKRRHGVRVDDRRRPTAPPTTLRTDE